MRGLMKRETMGRVELLSPAGNFHALKGAIKAGADAVYLGGALYGARAYADNFTQDEICAGIHLAHVFGKKIYLTVNTLVKEKELDGLYPFLLPLYEAGLDGVIVQDLGAVRYIREYFPELTLHASTQMTITGSLGAAMVKKEGISRIVPARELSLEEIKKIKADIGVEIEAFIHGAMCYCYSGQCLFSSVLGGRSGNRGRCAQPCRLPYQTEDKGQVYPLSMRDMCTIDLLPELIDAGIDSFKIEGRMKKPAYAAGVTAIYRKYIDLYNRDKEHYFVAQEDREFLHALYLRSQTGDGYYHRHNGKEMITLHSPSYSETDVGLLSELEKTYIEGELCHHASAKVFLIPGQEARLFLKTEKQQVTCRGDLVQKAERQPLAKEKIEEQMKKSANTHIKITDIDVNVEGDVFLPVRSLNELRRKTISALEAELIRQNGLDYSCRKAVVSEKKNHSISSHTKSAPSQKKVLHALVNTLGQLRAACKAHLPRIYLNYSLLEEESLAIMQLSKKNNTKIRQEFFIATPYIVREKDSKYLEKMDEVLLTGVFDGVLIRNLESFSFFDQKKRSVKMVIDTGLYVWNRESLKFWEGRAAESYLPLECNMHEWRELLETCPDRKMQISAVVYGRFPMMITANCIRKTMGSCRHVPGWGTIKDRYGKQFPVYMDCLCCYNVLYNSVPLSLHKVFTEKNFPAECVRLDFTTEESEETLQIIHYFGDIFRTYREPSYKEYTTGHYKRGVE
ncbi:putative protease YdcP [Lachnospiraceae bacterium]|nr:putative protease YdcP [Lachnospiraceae bacterium]